MCDATGEAVRNQNLPQKLQEKTRKRNIVRLLTRSDAVINGILAYRNLHFPAALGKGGVRAQKREGDGATPLGMWAAVKVYYRPDKVGRPATRLPAEALRQNDGWCDAPHDRNYNRKVTLPYPRSAERLWRDDRLYDVIVILAYNMRPRAQGRGSAIFMHVARPSFKATEGCIAMRQDHLLRLLSTLSPGAVIAAGKTLTISAGSAAGSSRGRSHASRGRVLWRRSSPHASAGRRDGGLQR